MHFNAVHAEDTESKPAFSGYNSQTLTAALFAIPVFKS